MYGIYQTLAVEPLPMFSPPAGAISAFGKYPDAPAVKNRWTRRSETTTPTDATAQRSSRWPRSEIV